jgi:hypothetical protein
MINPQTLNCNCITEFRIPYFLFLVPCPLFLFLLTVSSKQAPASFHNFHSLM